MHQRILCIISCMLTTACLYDWPAPDSTIYPCASQDECVEGYSCLSGNCVAQGATDTTGNSDDTPQELVTPIEGTLACGYDFCCGIKSDGAILCWGDNPGGQGTANSVIPNQTTSSFDWITADANRLCGVTTNGGVECFGGGNPPAPKDEGAFTQVSASNDYACGIQDNNLECWGNNVPAKPDSVIGAKSISTAQYSACSLDENNSITCWGTYIYDPPLTTWDSISICNDTHCGIRNEQIYCWGELNPLETQEPAGDSFIALSVAEHFAGDFDRGRALCALTKFGAIECSCCKTGAFDAESCFATNNLDVCKYQPSEVGPFIQIAVGESYACAMRINGTVACWGLGSSDGFGGQNRMENVNPPSDVTFKTSRN